MDIVTDRKQSRTTSPKEKVKSKIFSVRVYLISKSKHKLKLVKFSIGIRVSKYKRTCKITYSHFSYLSKNDY